LNQVRTLRTANQRLSKNLRKLIAYNAAKGDRSATADVKCPVLEPKFALMMWLKLDKKDFGELESIFHDLAKYSPPRGSPSNWQSLYTAVTGLLKLIKGGRRPSNTEFADLKQDVNLLLKSLETEDEELGE
jgi:hypothetical protein